MDLKPRQLSALAEMGIPVWELRQHEITEPDNTPEHTINSVEIDEELLQCDWLVLIDQQTHNEQTQRLLQAMLSTIGLSIQSVAIVSSDQLSQLQYLPATGKVLLAFGTTIAAKLLPDNQASIEEARGKAHQILPSKIITIISFSLNELLNHPENKVLAWQDLQLAKLTHQQLGQD